jgi:hypothetical protein
MKEDIKYEVTRVHIKSMEFDVMILKLLDSEIEDKLTYFSRDKGLIEKSRYDDFLIATCITNVGNVVEYLQQRKATLDEVNGIRTEIVENILRINPLFNPTGIVINKNNVLKLSKRGNKNVRKLLKNELWGRDYYKDGIPQAQPPKEPKKLDMDNKVKNLKDVKYTPVQKFWKRIGQYVTVKQFSEDDADIIIGGREFNTQSAFRQYVVTVCIEDVEDLFVKLDALGLPNRVPSQDLIHELYELCVGSNPFLSSAACKADCDTCDDPFNHKQATAEEKLGGETEPTKAKLFKHVKKETLLNLGNDIKTKVVGQDKAVDVLVDAIQRASVGLKDPDHPLGAFVFAGYSGTGKTYASKILAESLIGSSKGLITIDCSEYSSDHEYAKLIGAPAGYIGYESGGYLTNAVKKQPFSVILFDEIEKASDKVHQLLLQIMEEARLTDGKGHPVSFKDSIIVMTSNIGVKEVNDISKTIGFGHVSKVTDDKRTKAVEKALKDQFKPEFLNRVTNIINFNSLTKENYLQIIKLEIEKLKLNLKLSGTEYSHLLLNFDDSLLEHIYNTGIDEKYGARPLKRAIEQEISSPLARKLLNEEIIGKSEITISIQNGVLCIDVKKVVDPDTPPFYMEVGKKDE